MNNRRKLLIALGAGGLVVPLACLAQQQGKVWRVGFVSLRRRPDSLDSDTHGAFSNGMRELGYVEGKNLVIEWRFADDKYERLPDLAVELVRLKVDVIVTAGTQATSAAQKATTRIPIVFGGARLLMKPLPTGSLMPPKTIGIVVVAFCAAIIMGVPAGTITSTFIFTNSAARVGRRSYMPSAKRHSITKFLPSTYPSSRIPFENAPKMSESREAGRLRPDRKPTRHTLPCC